MPVRLSMRPSLLLGPAATVMLFGISGQASAQTNFLNTDTELVRTALPEGYDRGRNVSVLERNRTDYAALGIRDGGILIYPKLTVAAGATSNTFLTDTNKKSSAFTVITPAVNVQSDWARHAITFDASGNIQRYFGNSERDQSGWSVGGTGRLDVTDELAVTAEADADRLYESPYAGSVQSVVAVLSSYVTGYQALRAEYQAGRTRFQISGDRTTLRFGDIDFSDGTVRLQGDRSRNILRVTGQAEYAFSPSIAAYAKVSYDGTDYTQILRNGNANRDSTGYRFTGGLNFDLSGFMRGTIGVGYVRRNYDSPLYKDVGGPSVEAKIDYFPSELTTWSLQLRRVLEDSNVGGSTAYFDNRVTVRVDHELLRNLLVSAYGSGGLVDYIGISGKRKNFQLGGAAQYLISHRFGLRADVGYGKQIVGSGAAFGRPFSEVRGQLGFYVQG